MNGFLRAGCVIFSFCLICPSYARSDESTDSNNVPFTAIYYSGFDILRPMSISEENIEKNSCRVFVKYFEIEYYLQKSADQSVGYNSKNLSMKIVSGRDAYYVDRNRIVRVAGAASDALIRFDKDKFMLNYGKSVRASCDVLLNKPLER